jgi:hypothetical protein
MIMKSERLKRLETELQDLDQWLRLGLVPKKDVAKHKGEIKILKEKIEEEKERLRFLKESGAMEEFIPPKRNPHARQPFSDTASMPDIEMSDEDRTDFGLDETESYDFETSSEEETEGFSETCAGVDDPSEEEDPFSDRNRWKRGVLEDPDANN